MKNFLCNSLETTETARTMRLAALILTAFGALIWSVIAVASLFEQSVYGNWTIAYASLFCLIAWGLYKMRREAAIAGFAVSFLGIFFDWGSNKVFSDSLMMIIDVFAIWGTFAYTP
jgi:hypothetical protein